MAEQGRIEDWVSIPVILEALGKRVEGTVKFGVRVPMKPGTTPLLECPVESRDLVNGQRPGYWFVNDDEAIKVELLSYKPQDETLSGLGQDREVFNYVIRRR